MPGGTKSPSSKKGLSPAGSQSSLATSGDVGRRTARHYTEGSDGLSCVSGSLRGGETERYTPIISRSSMGEESYKSSEVYQVEAAPISPEEESIDAQSHTADAQALLALPTPPRCKVPLSSGESRLNGLLQHHLFGVSQPDSDAAAPPVAGSKTSGRSNLKHLAPDDSTNMTFRPQVLEKSRSLASNRNAAWVYNDEEDPEKLIPFSTSERLYADLPSEDQRKVARKLLRQAEMDKDNTFAPVISKQSKALVAAKEAQEGREWWDVLSNPKTKREKVQDTAPEKKTPEQKRIDNWNTTHKKVPFVYKPGQDVESYECTFHPKISPKAQKCERPPQSARVSSPRKKAVTAYREDGFCSRSSESYEFHPAFSVIANFYKRNHLLGTQTQPLMKAYQRPHLSGLQPYSRSHNGIAANMQIEGDPVFEDLHDMLHSMKF